MSDEVKSGGVRRVSGRMLVAAMFAMGITATGLLFLYWNLHLMPFMPLQKAIVAEFKGSAPRVEGGRRKMHKGTPMLLRVVMKVPFDPVSTDTATTEKLDLYMRRIHELASVHTEIQLYEFLEVHFYHLVKEKELRERTLRRSLKSWEAVDENGKPMHVTEKEGSPGSL